MLKRKKKKTSAKHDQVKCIFWYKIFINFTGDPLYDEFLDIICHRLIYFAILTYIDEL